MTKIATQLTEEGRRELAHFLADNLSDKNLVHLIGLWESDITFDINGGTEGYLELSGFSTRTGNPAVNIFFGGAVVLEDYEEDQE